MIVRGNKSVVSLLCDEVIYVRGNVQDLPPKEVSGWCVWRGAPEIFLISVVSGRTINLRVALCANLVVSGHLP